MSDISASECRLLRETYGDLAYEEPHRHREMLELLGRPKLRLVVDNAKKQ